MDTSPGVSSYNEEHFVSQIEPGLFELSHVLRSTIVSSAREITGLYVIIFVGQLWPTCSGLIGFVGLMETVVGDTGGWISGFWVCSVPVGLLVGLVGVVGLPGLFGFSGFPHGLSGLGGLSIWVVGRHPSKGWKQSCNHKHQFKQHVFYSNLPRNFRTFVESRLSTLYVAMSWDYNSFFHFYLFYIDNLLSNFNKRKYK